MDGKYILESESEEEEVQDADLDAIKSSITSDGWQLQDIDQLKKQTSALLDPSWKAQRNKHLIIKLLDLEQPVITAKMVDFLLQDGVCETLLSFITQNGPESIERNIANEQNNVEMKLAYRAVVLLSPEIITEPLNAVLSRKASLIAQLLFNVFLDNSSGSFYHVYRLFECLLRCYPTETFDGLVLDGNLSYRFSNLLRYVGYPPVCELFVMIVAFTPISRSSQLFVMCEKTRWSFLQELNKWNLLLNLTLAVVSPAQICRCTQDINDDQHSTAACQLFQDLIEKVSLEDTGDLLLLPLGHDSSIIDKLIDTIISEDIPAGLKRSAAKIICFLLRRAAESEIVCFVTTSPNVPPTTTYLPNRLFALRERIVTSVKQRVQDLTSSLLTYDETLSSTSAVKYSSYEVKKPFSTLRLLIVEIIVLTVESDETVAGVLPLELWKSLIAWTLKYCNNNIYHALFYRIIFAVLRQGQEAPQKILFQKAKFASFLAENFLLTAGDADQNEESNGKDSVRKKLGIRGLLMNCANAIRLQISTQTPTSFLVNFLGNHGKWNEFINELTIATDVQLKFGMGIKVTVMDSKNVNSQQNSMMMLVSEAKPQGGSEEILDHSMRFAKSLGFYEDAPWSLTNPTASLKDVEDEMSVDELISQDKKQYMEDSGRLSYLGEDD